jgi:hypothetical protein
MLKYVVIALMALTILGFAQTPGDIVRQSKIVQPQVLDLSNTDPSVFNTTAFENQLEGVGRLNASLPTIPQNDVGILYSSLAFLNTSMDLQQLTNVVPGNS